MSHKIVAVRERIPVALKSLIKVARAEAFYVCGSRRYAFPAINNLDRQLLDLLPQQGTFLEIGGNDGYSQSNTYFLEKHLGWDGILIEPLRSLSKVSRLHRKASIFNVACAARSGTTELVDRGLMTVSVDLLEPEDDRSKLRKASTVVTVPTRTLSSIIKDSGFAEITFMSIDVEGAELSVLAGLELDQHCPRFLLVETSKISAVEHALRSHMYLDRQLSFHDYFFVRKSTTSPIPDVKAE